MSQTIYSETEDETQWNSAVDSIEDAERQFDLIEAEMWELEDKLTIAYENGFDDNNNRVDSPAFNRWVKKTRRLIADKNKECNELNRIIQQSKHKFAGKLRRKNKNLVDKVDALEEKIRKLKTANKKLHEERELYQSACFRAFCLIMIGDEKEQDPNDNLDDIYNLLLEVNPKMEYHYNRKKAAKDPDVRCSYDMPVNT